VGLDGAAEEGWLETVGSGDHAAVGWDVGGRPGEEELTSPPCSSRTLEQPRDPGHEVGWETGRGSIARHNKWRRKVPMGRPWALQKSRELIRHLVGLIVSAPVSLVSLGSSGEWGTPSLLP
jgi:hypothetical protein